jgi:hypothetical protein
MAIVSCMALHKSRVGHNVGHVHLKSRGWHFWLVQLRSSSWMDLRAGVKRQCAGVLLLVLVVASGGADGNG